MYKIFLSLLIVSSIAFTPVIASAQVAYPSTSLPEATKVADTSSSTNSNNVIAPPDSNDNLALPGTSETQDDNAVSESNDDSEGLSSDDSTNSNN